MKITYMILMLVDKTFTGFKGIIGKMDYYNMAMKISNCLC